MVFQKPTLFPWLTVEDNISFSLRMQHKYKGHEHEVEQIIQMIGLEKFKKDYPGQLSGGMAQRVALVHAMINKPEILLMDEPLGALDVFTRMNMQNEILDMWKKNHQLVIMVTHDIDEVVYMSSRVLVMDSHPGRINNEIKINLDYPRNRSNPLFIEYRNQILNLLHFAYIKTIGRKNIMKKRMMNLLLGTVAAVSMMCASMTAPLMVSASETESKYDEEA